MQNRRFGLWWNITQSNGKPRLPRASPNYPSAYAANVECEWEIRVEPGYKVLASFYQRFDLENSTDCRNDFVEV